MSKYFIAKNVANMMSKPDPNSSLASQVLAGALVSIEKTENDYCYIQTADSYHGWVSKLRLIEEWDISQYQMMIIKTLFANVYAKPDENSTLLTKLVISTCLPMTKSSRDKYAEIILPSKQTGYVDKNHIEPWENSFANEKNFIQKWQQSNTTERKQVVLDTGKRILEIAKCFMGTPYLWGGGTPFGIDCSGLTQLCYKLNGIILLRDSYMQYDDKRFEKIEKDKTLDKAQLNAGDLLVFDIGNKGKINHIGIACGGGTFIQARGEMRDGGMVMSECTDDCYKQAYRGAIRLSAAANVSINAAN